MVIQLVGKRTYWYGERFRWYSYWMIISGTGELKSIRGQGTWRGPGFEGPDVPGSRPDIYYEGEIHFH